MSGKASLRTFRASESCVKRFVLEPPKQTVVFVHNIYCIYAAKVRNVFVLLRDYIKEIEP